MVILMISINKPIGASPAGHFFGGGVLAKKVYVMLRGLRISEKKEILRKVTVHTFVLIYLNKRLRENI